jgi:DNA-binding transcriptional LysR family regulator
VQRVFVCAVHLWVTSCQKRRDIEQLVSGNLQVNNGETMRQAVLDGLGIARLGRWHVAEALASGKLVSLLEEFNPGDPEMIHAVYLGGGTVPTRVRLFIEYMDYTLGNSETFKSAR